jgi:hypothetical protein
LIYYECILLVLIRPNFELFTMFLKRTGLDNSAPAGGNSVDVLREIVGLEGHILKITPRGYRLSNGIEYCSVGVKGKNGIDYSIQAYGREALDLHNEAWTIMETPTMMFHG